MQINIGSGGQAYLQANDLAIGLARPSPAAGIASTLAFTQPARDLIGTGFTVSMASAFFCFAASGTFRALRTVVPALTSTAIDRAAVAATGAVCAFRGTRIDVSTSSATPAMLMIENASENDRLTMGLAEEFETGAGLTPAAPTLLTAVAPGMRLILTEIPTTAFLFVVQAAMPAGTIIPAMMYAPMNLATSGTAGSVTIGQGVLVDLSDENLSVTFNETTNMFELP
jgi:hypothetical protein